MYHQLQQFKYQQRLISSTILLISILMTLLPILIHGDTNEQSLQMENPKISWPDPNRDRDRRQVGLGSLAHDGSHSGDHGDRRSDSIAVSDGSRSSISSPSRNKDELAPRRQYPNRNYKQSYAQQDSNFRNSNDPSSTFRQQSRQSPSRQNVGGGTFPYDPYQPNRGNSSYSSRVRNVQQDRKSPITTKRPAKSSNSGKDSTKDPFDDPDRYRVPQLEQAADNVRFVNGRPYR